MQILTETLGYFGKVELRITYGITERGVSDDRLLIGGRNYVSEPTTTGVLIQNSSGYSSSTTGAMTTDGTAANNIFKVGQLLYDSDRASVGVITAVAPTTITIGGGTLVGLSDNEDLYSIKNRGRIGRNAGFQIGMNKNTGMSGY